MFGGRVPSGLFECFSIMEIDAVLVSDGQRVDCWRKTLVGIFAHGL